MASIFSGGLTISSFELKNSTISNNHAANVVGGLYAGSASVKLWNSTIAFNTRWRVADGHAAGAELSANSNAMAARVQSTLISNNSLERTSLDSGYGPDIQFCDVQWWPSRSREQSHPRDPGLRTCLWIRKQGFCPHLGPLRDNGGLTFTHALRVEHRSPAIDAGNDSSLAALYDQRGSAAVNGDADYTRFSGITSLTDIGAYEVQQNDIVFNTDFDDCPALAF